MGEDSTLQHCAGDGRNSKLPSTTFCLLLGSKPETKSEKEKEGGKLNAVVRPAVGPGAEIVVGRAIDAKKVVGLAEDRQISNLNSNGSVVGASTSVQLKTTVGKESNGGTALGFTISIGQSGSVSEANSSEQGRFCKHLKRYDYRRCK